MYFSYFTARQLRAARVLAGLTQRELADSAGVHFCTVRYWEKRGGRNSQYGVRKILAALEHSGVFFVDHDGETALVVKQDFP